ncbi:hypothetical protein [Actinomycetospora straminea]|uniref:Uncharacterized protein n=1 Tax=Actinomycetospora straminea TaxID=663607 RepID=A0ABP9E654_9PSEU|nr:hypothetical protein [Actinomycetospora straminea]MDD7935983.1 hypothetical protein [Actinomycetospora straminea]
MALRAPRLLTAALAGGVLTGTLLLGAGSALAAPAADDVVEARCGETVRAEPGQTVKVIPDLGLPFLREVTRGMDPITKLVGGLLCRVQVQVVEPVSEQVAQAAPPLRPATEQLSRGTGAVLDPEPQEAPTSASRAARTPAPAAAAAPTLTPQQAAAAAPAFAPAFGALPSSFLRSASGPAPGLRALDPNALLGSAFPGLRAGAPAYLGYDSASAVTTASQVQALPVDGLSDGGVGVPALIAVLALSGVAAFTVRRVVLGKATAAASAAPVVTPEEDDVEAGATATAATTARSAGDTGATRAVGAAEDTVGNTDEDDAEDLDEAAAARTPAVGRTPVPA